MNLMTKFRWWRNNRQSTKACLCGEPTEVIVGHGPAKWGRCLKHKDYPLTATWIYIDEERALPEDEYYEHMAKEGFHR